MKTLINAKLSNSVEKLTSKLDEIKQEIKDKESRATFLIEKSDAITTTLKKLHLNVDDVFIVDKYVTIHATPIDDKFKFIKNRGFDSQGRGKNRTTLYNKSMKISDKLKEATGMNTSVNPFSLESSDSMSKNVLITMYL